MSPEELWAIEARVNAASPAPWHNNSAYLQVEEHADGRLPNSWAVLCAGPEYLAAQRKADCEFMAHARQDIPKLLEEIERLKGLTGYETMKSIIEERDALRTEAERLGMENTDLYRRLESRLDTCDEHERSSNAALKQAQAETLQYREALEFTQACMKAKPAPQGLDAVTWISLCEQINSALKSKDPDAKLLERVRAMEAVIAGVRALQNRSRYSDEYEALRDDVSKALAKLDAAEGQ